MRQVLPYVLTLFVAASAACGGSSDGSLDGATGDGGSKLGASPPGDAGGLTLGEGAGPPTSDGAAGDSAVEGADGGDAGLVVNPNPTVSSWMGTNIAADLPFVDVAYLLTPFNTAAAKIDANGYPIASASGTSSTDIGYILPTGTYDISYVGSGTLAVSGIGKLGGAWQSVNGERRNTLTITGTPGSFGNFLTLTVTNGANQTVTGIHIYFPGFTYDSTQTFVPQFLSLLTPFRAMRFMDWESTNNSTLANWADRPAAAHFGQSSYGQPYEDIAELANETGKDAWITIPELATDDFITQFATFMAQNLDFARIQAARDQAGFTTPFQLIVENSNETWNTGFSAYNTFLTAAKANPSRYTGTYAGTYGPSWMSQSTDLMMVAQYEADRLVKIGNAFRTAFTAVGHGDAIAPVLSGWALGAVYSDEGLQFIQAKYGAPKNYVSYVAQAPYFSTADSTTDSLDALFAGLQSTIAGMDATFKDFAALGTQYGVTIAGYEGGQGLSGTTNQTLKHLAQHDERMYETYLAFVTLWKQDFGSSLFMHYNLAGDPGEPENIYQYGFWGSIIGVLEDTATCEPNLPMLTGTEAIASVVHHCPKYRALAEQVP